MAYLTKRIGLTQRGLETFSTPELVRLGAEVWQTFSEAKALSDTVKTVLRERYATLQSQAILTGPGALCTLTLQKGVPQIQGGVDIPLLKQLLGEDFSSLFDEVTTVTAKSPFLLRLMDIKDPNRVQVALAAVNIPDNKIRVSFTFVGPKE